MSACVLTMSSFDTHNIDNELSSIELEERYLLGNLLNFKEDEPVIRDDWIVDESKYSRKQKRSFSDLDSDCDPHLSKRQDVGSGSAVLRESYSKLSPADKITFKAIILDRTREGPMEFGPYYMIEQVEAGKINIVQKDMWTRLRYIAAKYDSSVHLIENWNKVYMTSENDAPAVEKSSCEGCASPDSQISSNTKSSEKSSDSALPRIRFASKDNIVYI